MSIFWERGVPSFSRAAAESPRSVHPGRKNRASVKMPHLGDVMTDGKPMATPRCGENQELKTTQRLASNS